MAEAQEVPIVGNQDEYKIVTAPFDARFPNQNQTKNCWQNFVDFQRCKKLKGDDYQPCQYFDWVARSICPSAWYEKWQEEVESGTFAGKV